MQRHQAPLKELTERWIGLLGDCNGKNPPTKGEETEREKKLNQRFTVQDKEEEDGVKETGRSQREEHNEGC